MKTLHCFKPDFKYKSVIPKEWFHIDEFVEFKEREFNLITFRCVEKMKVVNTTKEILLGHFKISKEEIVSESFLDDSEFLVNDGQFIMLKIKRNITEEEKIEIKEQIYQDNNFFFYETSLILLISIILMGICIRSRR